MTPETIFAHEMKRLQALDPVAAKNILRAHQAIVAKATGGTQLDMRFDDEENRQIQRSKVLKAMRAAGKHGCTNVELNQIQFRYGASIFVLRSEGYMIATTREVGRVFRFTLLSEPEKTQ